MSSFLLFAYTAINIGIAILFYKREKGVFQLPFLIACVSLTFVLPQLAAIITISSGADIIELPLAFMCACNIALFYGFYKGEVKPIREPRKYLNVSNLTTKIAAFAIIGISAYFMNRGQYKGGFVSGVFVIINFFESYLAYSMMLSLLLINNGTKKKWVKYLLVFMVILSIDKVFQSARRAETIALFLSIGYFLETKLLTYKRIRILVPLFFVAGALFNTQIGDYRSNAYSGEVSVWDNIKNIDLSGALVSMQETQEGEIYNAITGINYCNDNSVYDYGAFNWNGIINNFIPKALVGESLKNILYIKTDYDSARSEMTSSGGTMTGYFDAFASFGILGWIKFFLIGYIMGALWRKRDVSPLSILLYIGLLTPSLHLLTHSSGNFFSSLVFFYLLVYPFIKNSVYKYEG